VENFGVLWNGDYVVCCTDPTADVLANAADVSLRDYLSCRRCGDRPRLSRLPRRSPALPPVPGRPASAGALCRQVGSIIYFKLYRRLVARGGGTEAV
jgi:hypothetical protein